MRVIGVLIAAAIPLAAFASDEDHLAGIEEMAASDDGRLAAFSKAWSRQFAVCEGGEWRIWQVPELPSPSQPRAIQALPGSRFAVLWASAKNEWILTVFRSRELESSIRFTWPVSSWDRLRLEPGGEKNLWLTGEIPRIIRLDWKSGEAKVFDMEPFRAGHENSRWNRFGVVEERSGTAWVFSELQADNSAHVPGLVRIRGDTMEHVQNIEGFPGTKIIHLSVRDQHSLWLADRKEGLFVFETSNLKATQIQPPDSRDFIGLSTILPLGRNWVALAGAGSRKSAWLLSGGEWKNLLQPDSSNFVTWDRSSPSSAELDSGRLLSLAEGALFLPRDASPPKEIGWRTGLPLIDPKQILALGGDRFAMISGRGTNPRWIVGDLADYLSVKPAADLEIIEPWRGWAVDREERVFTLMSQNPIVLSMWSGGKWHEIPLPPDIKADRIEELAIDAKDRLWAFSSDPYLPVAVLSPDREIWTLFRDYFDALTGLLDGLPGFLEDRHWMRPILSSDGRIAFRTQRWELNHWNGRSWATWKLSGIIRPNLSLAGCEPGSKKTAGIPAETKGDRISTPFFDKGGQLCVNSLKTDYTWKLEQNGEWLPHPKEPGIPDMWTSNQPDKIDRTLPAGFPHSLKNPSISKDNIGTVWVAGNGTLYRSRNGKTVTLFQRDTVHPFISNPQIGEVRVDTAGNVWIKMGIGNTLKHIRLAAPERMPAPNLHLNVDQDGRASLQKRPDSDLEWSLDGKNFQKLNPSQTSLGFLPSGENRVHFRLVDERLDVWTPPPILVAVNLSQEEQFRRLAGILESGPGEKREEAISALARLPQTAIPILEEAIRTTEDPWWLRVALQECRRQLQKSSY